MEVMHLDGTNREHLANRAAEVLRAGGVVLYPTDTLYGLGADALSDAAVAKIYAIKVREEKKPIHAIAADIEMVSRYAQLSDIGAVLAKNFWPGALTLLFKKKQGVDSGIAKDIETIGFRIPDNEFCIALAREFGGPITATSANRSGEQPQRNIEAILKQLAAGSYSNVLQKTAIGIDLIVDAGELPARMPSTVVDVSADKPMILREGAIPASEIEKSAGSWRD